MFGGQKWDQPWTIYQARGSTHFWSSHRTHGHPSIATTKAVRGAGQSPQKTLLGSTGLVKGSLLSRLAVLTC